MCRVGLAQAKRMCHRSVSSRIRDLLGMKNVPEGHIAVYVGETSKSRFMIPISYLNHPLFEGLLNLAEEEFGFNYPASALPKCNGSRLPRTWVLLITHRPRPGN
ncbi:hypothetical protein Golax_011227 [Gossypium laxum]|uniref:Uncharacterized protein n=1 Tax=Gossypium laxum TaxID=34288 RepID=A0A7J8ZK83_9ROSI|nr:hypothetical protein [Gossypium laxum]